MLIARSCVWYQTTKLRSCSGLASPSFFAVAITGIRRYSNAEPGSLCASVSSWIDTDNELKGPIQAHCRETLPIHHRGVLAGGVVSEVSDKDSNNHTNDHRLSSIHSSCDLGLYKNVPSSISLHCNATYKSYDAMGPNNAAVEDGLLDHVFKGVPAHSVKNSRQWLLIRNASDYARGGSMQQKSPSTVDDLLGAQTIEGLEGNVVSYGEETEQLGVHGQSLYGRKLTANETMLATSVLNLLESTGWTEITRGYLIEIQSQKLSFPVVSKILIQLKDFYLVSSLFQWVCKHIGHDVQVYHAYLRALIKTKQFMKMWDFLDRMRDNSIEISIATFCLMIKECRISGEPAMAVKVFNKAPHYGVELNNVLHQCLLSSLFLSNLAQEAKLLYRKMVCENCILDVHIFNTLIHGFGLSSSKEDVNKSFQLMLQAGIKPNLSSYKALIAAFCNVHLVDAAILTFFRLKDASFEVDASILNVLVEGLCGMDMFDNAIDIISKFQMWCPPDVSTGIILLKWLLSKNEVSRAIDMFLSMEEGGFTNRWTYIALSNGLRRCNQTTEIRHFLLDLFARYGYANLEVCHALLYSLTSCGDVAKSEELFKGILESTTEPILCFYATMISFYCRQESVEQALHLLLDLKSRGYRPGVFCYAPIMSALIKAGQPKYALRCFEEMQECGCEINGVMCDFLLRGLCKHEMVADVPHIVDTILRNKFSMSASTFMELVKCMCNAGKIEEANILFKSLHGLSCLQIGKEAAKQAASVIRVMSKP